MKILAIDTSGLVCAVAVAEDGRIQAEYKTDHKKTHSQMLMPMLDAMARALDLDLHTLDAIAVAEGPGSFTGLRIGASTAKGMAFALGIPVIPVPTLDAMAWQMPGTPGIICPMMDARRGQVYTALYRFREICDGTDPGNRETLRSMETLMPAAAVPAQEVLSRINEIGETVTFLGDGVPVVREIIREKCTVPYREAPAFRCRQSAAALADLAGVLMAAGKGVSAAAFTPVYLRPSQAEREAAAAAAAVSGQTAEPAEEEREPEKQLREIVIRRMTAQDVQQGVLLEEECLGQEAWSGTLFGDAVARRDTLYLMAESGGAQIGHAGIRAVCGEGEITNVCVKPVFRRQGIGEKLLRQLIHEGRRSFGIGDCTLEVRAGNTAAAGLYEKCGFVPEGRRPGFYERPSEDAVIYWLRGDL